jgi:hypothetical protein
MAKVAFKLRLRIVRRAQRHHVNDLDIAHMGSLRNQCIHKN